MLYEKRRQYDKILSCYLRDYARKVRCLFNTKNSIKIDVIKC